MEVPLGAHVGQNPLGAIAEVLRHGASKGIGDALALRAVCHPLGDGDHLEGHFQAQTGAVHVAGQLTERRGAAGEVLRAKAVDLLQGGADAPCSHGAGGQGKAVFEIRLCLQQEGRPGLVPEKDAAAAKGNAVPAEAAPPCCLVALELFVGHGKGNLTFTSLYGAAEELFLPRQAGEVILSLIQEIGEGHGIHGLEAVQRFPADIQIGEGEIGIGRHLGLAEE